jgi:hypothetical protein
MESGRDPDARSKVSGGACSDALLRHRERKGGKSKRDYQEDLGSEALLGEKDKDDRDQDAAQDDEYARTGEPLELLALYASRTPVACHQCDGREEHR